MERAQTSWHTVEADKAATMLDTDVSSGLLHEEAVRRLETYGKNAFERGRRLTLFDRFLTQIKSPLVFILLLAGVATLLLGEYVDATVIFIAFVVNVAIGLYQETRASQAFEKLAASQERRATVMRDGRKHVVAAASLVPGDVVLLTAGSVVPADMYLLEARELEISEAALTGESVPIQKEPNALPENVPLTDRVNMAWMGTYVESGEGKGIVVATGNETQIGRIAEELSDAVEVQTPIQKNIRRLARFLSLIILGVVVLIFVLGMMRGQGLEVMLLLAIAVAVSVIPEGLPAAVTAILAIGMEKILSRGGLVRNLLAAETLGSTTVILTDKTGTLTKAQMRLFLFVTAGDTTKEELSGDAQQALTAAIYASDAFVENDEKGERVVHGRPVERAVIERGLEEGLEQEKLLEESPRLDFLPFDSSRRFDASLHKGILHVSGAPGTLLDAATHVLKDGAEETLSEEERAHFREKLDTYASEGVRFIAAGYKKTDTERIEKESAGEMIGGLVFVGLLGFEDPIREDVSAAIATAKRAGARVIMLTGDNPQTARSIAIQAGVVAHGTQVVMRGSELEDMSDEELRRELARTAVFARMLPEQKLRMVKLLQEDEEVVAMTGDGVNDAPALKRADIGVAVGSGTDVAQEASDLILLNDSFSIIVAAIEEGRRIIDNLKKAIAHLLSTSFGEVFVIAGAIGLGLPLPILAVQILWLNIIEEGLLTFGFAFEPPEDGIMERSPRSGRVRNVVNKEMRTLIIAAGSATGMVVFLLYLLLLHLSFPIEVIRTIVFTALSLDALFFAVSLKNFYTPLWRVKLFSNKYLLVALSISVVLLVASRTLPVFQELLQIAPFTKTSLLILGVIAVIDVLIIEFAKYFLFRRRGKRTD